MGTGTVYLGLGSNLGDRAALLAEAVAALEAAGAISDVVGSALYETDAVADEPQPPYLNAVVRARTALEPEALLDACLAVERTLGRVRRPGRRNEARPIDVDILLYGDVVRAGPEPPLVPHPRLLERGFVRAPLADVAEPGLRHPVTGEPLGPQGRALPSGVRRTNLKAAWVTSVSP